MKSFSRKRSQQNDIDVDTLMSSTMSSKSQEPEHFYIGHDSDEQEHNDREVAPLPSSKSWLFRDSSCNSRSSAEHDHEQQVITSSSIRCNSRNGGGRRSGADQIDPGR